MTDIVEARRDWFAIETMGFAFKDCTDELSDWAIKHGPLLLEDADTIQYLRDQNAELERRLASARADAIEECAKHVAGMGTGHDVTADEWFVASIRALAT